MDNAKMIALERLHDSPFQPRKKYTKIDELAASMKELGVLQPLLVREVKGDYEIVAGHRRKRGAKKAGLKEVPCVITVMTDQQVREAILIENGQREDVPPLEELEIYKQLREDGMEIGDIAAKIGRTDGYVYRRMQLTKLLPKGRSALAAGELGLATAEMIARITDKKLQDRAVENLSADAWSSPATVNQAKRWMEENATMLLSAASFDTKDATLTGAGSCAVCPKNTSGTMLFPDLDKAKCIDSTCFRQKMDASWANLAKAAEAKHQTVLEGEDAAKVFHDYGGVRAHWIDLADARHVDIGTGPSKRKTFRQILGKRLETMKIHLVRDRAGKIYEIVKRSEVKKSMKSKPTKGDPRELAGTKDAFSIKLELELKTKKQYEHSVLHAIAKTINTKKLAGDIELWRMLAHGVLARSWAATMSLALKRRKIVPDEEKHETNGEVLIRYIDGDVVAKIVHEASMKRSANVRDLQVLVLELLVVPEFAIGDSSFFHSLLDPDTGYIDTINVDAIYRDAADRVKADVKMKSDKAAAKKKKTNGKQETAVITGKGKEMDMPSPETILAAIENGQTQTELAKALGLSRGQISRLLKKARAT